MRNVATRAEADQAQNDNDEQQQQQLTANKRCPSLPAMVLNTNNSGSGGEEELQEVPVHTHVYNWLKQLTKFSRFLLLGCRPIRNQSRT